MICEEIRLSEKNEKVVLKTYRMDPKMEMLGDKIRPAVLVLGGGAYFSVSDSEGEPVALSFATMGYHAFTLKYSTYGPDAFITGFQNMKPREKTQYPQPLYDVARAVLYIKEHAAEWNIDPDRIAVCGFSAGAHNAAMYITHFNKPILTEHFGCSAEKLSVALGILGYPLTDYVYMKEAMEQGKTDPFFFGASNMAYLGKREPEESLLKEVSPRLAVDEQTPPCFIWTTAKDSMVPAQHSLLLALALADQGIPYELHVFENGPHGMSVASQVSAAAKDQIDNHIHHWVELAKEWMESRFALDLPEQFSFADADEAIAKTIRIES